ncbi:MAG: hypothetical protein JWM68_3892, partial [Verrucomicrobiales bacterium]|nr:hypothetical protein [Verrucomicrobiales bacterium]
IGLNTNGVNAEIYGNICYYNGWQGCDRGHGHGIYAQNVDPSVVKIDENIFYGNYALGIQITGNDSVSDNFQLEGNVIFFNGSIAREHQANFLLGSFEGKAKNPLLIRNFIYDTQGSTDSDANIGYAGGSIGGVVSDNYFQTSVHFSEHNDSLTLQNNIFLSNTVHLVTEDFPDNFYLAGVPQSNLVEVRTNKYEPGRANIIVYNWEHATTLAVDVSSCLQVGMSFEVRNAQDFFGAPVLTGTYNGDLLNLPMTGLAVAKPKGTNSPPAAAPNFGTFILLPVVAGNNSLPYMSFIDDMITEQNVSTAPAYFAVWDAETSFDYLIFSVQSSNPTLISHPNIVLGGNEFARTITIAPTRNEIGTAIITLTVSDGILATSASFSVTVNPGTDMPPPGSRTNIEKGMISLRIQSDRSAFLEFRGNSGDAYKIQASDNLTDWSDMATLTADCGGLLEFTDADASLHSARYYRVALMPQIEVTP